MHPWFKKPNRKDAASRGVEVILAKLAKGYKNAAMEEADRKMLEIYLKGT
jgi:hypothetical protein